MCVFCPVQTRSPIGGIESLSAGSEVSYEADLECGSNRCLLYEVGTTSVRHTKSCPNNGLSIVVQAHLGHQRCRQKASCS